MVNTKDKNYFIGKNVFLNYDNQIGWDSTVVIPLMSQGLVTAQLYAS